MKLYGMWNFNEQDWVRDVGYTNEIAILAFESKRIACKELAAFFGYDLYSDMKKDGWGEVRELN